MRELDKIEAALVTGGSVALIGPPVTDGTPVPINFLGPPVTPPPAAPPVGFLGPPDTP